MTLTISKENSNEILESYNFLILLIFIVIAAPIIILDSLYDLSYWAIAIYIFYIFICPISTYFLLKKDMENIKNNIFSFDDTNPFEAIGSTVYNFHHVFHSEDKEIPDSLLNDIVNSAFNESPSTRISNIRITGCDKLINRTSFKFDSRKFKLIESQKTMRGGQISLLAKVERFEKIYNVKWWTLFTGIIDSGSIKMLIVLSPITLPFWIRSRLEGTSNLVSKIRKIYKSSYETQDLVVMAVSINKLMIEALIENLEKHGIETTDIKEIKPNLVNINISGGKNYFDKISQNINSNNGGK